jgi:site-specific recombinase XerD
MHEAGITKSITAHTLRHTFATRLYNQTGDIRLVQTALRHEHLSTTEIYAHLDPVRLRQAVNAPA